MKTLRRILAIIICLALILISIGLLLPRKIHVERSLLISAAPQSIYKQVNTIKNWGKWSSWLKLDSNAQLSFSGPESGNGANMTWESKNVNVGKGSLSIINSLPFDSILFMLDYGKKGNSKGKFEFIKRDKNTLVVWNLETDLGMNPISRWVGLFSDRMLGPELMRGLQNIRKLTEGLKVYDGFEISEQTFPEQILLSIRDTVSPSTISAKVALMNKKISHFLKLKNLPPTGEPITVFHNFSSLSFDIEVCLPISKLIVVPQGMSCYEKSQQKTLMIRYTGPYNLISKPYKALQNYINDNGLNISGPTWEEYITNPALETDTTKWQTNIYFPVNE